MINFSAEIKYNDDMTVIDEESHFWIEEDGIKREVSHAEYQKQMELQKQEAEHQKTDKQRIEELEEVVLELRTGFVQLQNDIRIGGKGPI